MSEQNALEQVYEQFHVAVRSLTMGNERLDERLSQAWLCRLMHVRESELADRKLAGRIADIKRSLQALSDLHEVEQAALAAEILSTYTAITEQLALVSSPH
ncbi:MAG: hypothetical protein ABSB88_17385 [Bryobacteraceae bacterium]|jgi:hypothetical protein